MPPSSLVVLHGETEVGRIAGGTTGAIRSIGYTLDDVDYSFIYQGGVRTLPVYLKELGLDLSQIRNDSPDWSAGTIQLAGRSDIDHRLLKRNTVDYRIERQIGKIIKDPISGKVVAGKVSHYAAYSLAEQHDRPLAEHLANIAPADGDEDEIIVTVTELSEAAIALRTPKPSGHWLG